MLQRDRCKKAANERRGELRGRPAFRVWMSIGVLAAGLGGCSAPPQPLTLTFGEDTCSLTGTPTASASNFSFKWVIEDQDHTMFNAILVQLDEGKTMEEFSEAAVGKYLYNLPSLTWAKILNDDFAVQAGPYSKDVTWNLKQNALFRPGQAYFACDYGENTVAVVGPVTIAE